MKGFDVYNISISIFYYFIKNNNLQIKIKKNIETKLKKNSNLKKFKM